MKKRRMLKLQITALAVWALSILLMYFTDLLYGKSFYRILLYANGILFWITLTAFIFISIVIDVQFRRNTGKRAGRRLPGMFCFFQNRYAIFIDVLLILSIVLCVAVNVCGLTVQSQLLSFIFVAAIAFLLGMHGILNGSHYAAFCDEEEKKR
ncbi:MAG: hypothetical protein ACI4AD_10125 [Roseburia sp.]